MDIVTDRAIGKCFRDETVHSIVRRVLRSTEQQPVEPLELLAVKSIMRREMDKDRETNVLCSLVLREPVSIADFHAESEAEDEVGDLPEDAVFKKLRMDPYVVMAVLEQHLSVRAPWLFDIHVTEHSLLLKIAIIEFANIPHRDNVLFDTYWAEKFARLAFCKHVETVSVEMNGKGLYDIDYLESRIHGMIENIKPIVPPEGWKTALENGNRPIYWRTCDAIWDNIIFVVQFNIEKRTYVPEREGRYWGYLE